MKIEEKKANTAKPVSAPGGSIHKRRPLLHTVFPTLHGSHGDVTEAVTHESRNCPGDVTLRREGKRTTPRGLCSVNSSNVVLNTLARLRRACVSDTPSDTDRTPDRTP